MRIIAVKTLRTFWEKHPDAESALQVWYHDAKHATWKTPTDIKRIYRNASILGNNRVVFNINMKSSIFDLSAHTPNMTPLTPRQFD